MYRSVMTKDGEKYYFCGEVLMRTTSTLEVIAIAGKTPDNLEEQLLEIVRIRNIDLQTAIKAPWARALLHFSYVGKMINADGVLWVDTKAIF